MSPSSVLVEEAPVESGATQIYSVLLPNVADTILDAVHSDLNETIVLTGAGLLEQFFPPDGNATDATAATINVQALEEGSYQTLQVTPNYAGVRVFTLAGSVGVLMLEVAIATFTVVGVLQLSQSSGLLYGADAVTYVRTADVESLRSGKVLVGTMDANGEPFETLIDLATRTIINTFDSSNLESARITTGEQLFTTPDSYSGSPMAPVLLTPTVANGAVTLVWQQTRPDLVFGYQIFMAQDYVAGEGYAEGGYGEGAYGGSSGTFSLAAIVSSGMSLSVVIPSLPSGATYTFEVQALSLDGDSALSNAVSISL
jgi:hypothetical protein